MSYKSSGTKSRPEREKPVPSGPGSIPSISDNINLSSRHRSNSDSSISSSSSIASFHSTHSRQGEGSSSQTATNTSKAPGRTIRFTPSQEQLHVTASNDLKSQANTQFTRGDFSSALQTYDRAIAELPVYLDYELAVLQSNIAACHLRLEEWRDAVAAAEKGWDCLENIDPSPKTPTKDPKDASSSKKTTDSKNNDDEAVVELPESNTDADDAELLKTLALSDQRRQDVRRIRTKLLLRRARARYVLGTTPPTSSNDNKNQDKNPFAQASALASSADPSKSSSSSAWSNLTAAQSDYQTLSQPNFFSVLPASDQKTVRHALSVLPALVEKAKEKEVAEMMGKLKELGNGILKPFGLSTDMFKMEKDPVSGGMSLRFDGK